MPAGFLILWETSNSLWICSNCQRIIAHEVRPWFLPALQLCAAKTKFISLQLQCLTKKQFDQLINQSNNMLTGKDWSIYNIWRGIYKMLLRKWPHHSISDVFILYYFLWHFLSDGSSGDLLGEHGIFVDTLLRMHKWFTTSIQLFSMITKHATEENDVTSISSDIYPITTQVRMLMKDVAFVNL